MAQGGDERKPFPDPSETNFPLADAAGWSALNAALQAFERTNALRAVLDGAKSNGADFALLEHEYIDADFRDEFVHYYATTYRPVANRCQRLHFFARGRYLGFSVLRPIHTRPVGRTVVAPPRELAPYVSCTVPVTVRPYDQQVAVRGFPFMEQDAQFGVCAHASVWMVARYHHLRYRTPLVVMSEIARAAAGHPELLRTTPSEGLTEKQVGFALQQLGIPAIPYAVGQLPPGERLSQIACRYLNSRLPVILTTEGHVTVLIGYGRDTKNRLFYLRADESAAPYKRVYASDDTLGPWSLLFVAMPGRIYVSGELAEAHARRMFTALLRRADQRATRKRLGPNLRLRSYAVQSGDYKVRMARRGMPRSVAERHRRVGASNWVWVVELQDPQLSDDTTRCVVGEIVIDATSDQTRPHALFGNLPGEAYVWTDSDPRKAPLPFEAREYPNAYVTGAAIHDAPTAEPAPRTVGARVRATRNRTRRRLKRLRPLRGRL